MVHRRMKVFCDTSERIRALALAVQQSCCLQESRERMFLCTAGTRTHRTSVLPTDPPYLGFQLLGDGLEEKAADVSAEGDVEGGDDRGEGRDQGRHHLLIEFGFTAPHNKAGNVNRSTKNDIESTAVEGSCVSRSTKPWATKAARPANSARTGRPEKHHRMHEQLQAQKLCKIWRISYGYTSMPDPTPAHATIIPVPHSPTLDLLPSPRFAISRAYRGHKQPWWPARALGLPPWCCALCTPPSGVRSPALASPPTDGS